jgi:hypothetical protein
MRRWILPLVTLNLLVLISLAFVYPHLMVSPGPLRSAHVTLTTDCFACHLSFRGSSAERCMACHALKDIGVRTTSGVARTSGERPAFHQELAQARCTDCHAEHQSGTLGNKVDKPFSHRLLREATQSLCEKCHRAPNTPVHGNAMLACAQCHQSTGWKPASFDHNSLTQADLQFCGNCHKPPGDDLHRNAGGACGRCHRTDAWSPASFDHDRFFVLEGEHNAPCATCHANNDFTSYTCYGCHAHTPTRVLEEHREEGIGDIKNCVRCHRSAREGDKEERD